MAGPRSGVAGTGFLLQNKSRIGTSFIEGTRHGVGDYFAMSFARLHTIESFLMEFLDRRFAVQ
jgi:hypothetical protein